MPSETPKALYTITEVKGSLIMLSSHSIETIIQKEWVQVHFQGIVNFYTEDYCAFESLVRPTEELSDVRPEQLFSAAENQGYLLELDYFCVVKAIEGFQKSQLQGLLFINILPINIGKILTTLIDKKCQGHLKGIVFEISEKHPLKNIEDLKEKIKTLRQHGALVAIDDLGAGHSGLISWAEIKPDFVKIDRHFITDIQHNGVNREFVRSIVEIARGLRCKVIAEGIETLDEMEVLQNIGIKLGQGYLLHRPEKQPSPIFTHSNYFKRHPKTLSLTHIRHAETAESLLETVAAITPEVLAEEVNDIFIRQSNLHCLPIANESLPVGIVSRAKLLEVFSGRYSHPLHGKKPIIEFMDDNPIIVDHQESLHDISNKITHNESVDLNTDFIITRHNRYCGVGKVSALLRLLTENQIQLARHSNPLTLLPGNVPIYEHIDDLISQKQSFHLAYFDINHFKPFNDFFGYSYGDEIIKQLSKIIIEHTSPRVDMVGHIGGDDFVVIFRSADWEEKCQRILIDFKSHTLKYYSKQELADQGVYYQDRRGNRDFFDLLSLAIGVVFPDISRNITHHEVSELANDAKKQAKTYTGNYLFISRRRSISTAI